MPKRRHNRRQQNNARARAQQTGGQAPPTQSIVGCKKKKWELTITVKTSAKYGYPSPAASIVFSSQLDGKDTPMSGKISSTVRWTGQDKVDALVHAECAGWVPGAAQRVSLSPGVNQHIDLELEGPWVEFQLLDAANPPAPVKDEKVKIFDATNKFLEDRTTDAQGVVRLENVFPQQYQISFTDRYDIEWKPY